MPRRTTSSIAYSDQAKFVVTSKHERELNFSESSLCCASKFGLVFISGGKELIVVKHSALESSYDGGDEEQQFDKSKVLSSRTFLEDIIMIKLSNDQLYISVITTKCVYVFHITSFSEKVFLRLYQHSRLLDSHLSCMHCQNALDKPLQQLEVESDSLNFDGLWSPVDATTNSNAKESLFAVLSNDAVMIISPQTGIVHRLEVPDATAMTWGCDSLPGLGRVLMFAVGVKLVVKNVCAEWTTVMETDSLFPDLHNDEDNILRTLF